MLLYIERHFFYFVLLIVFKLMGKREVGQLTLLDLVVSVLMAEIAAMALIAWIVRFMKCF